MTEIIVKTQAELDAALAHDDILDMRPIQAN